MTFLETDGVGVESCEKVVYSMMSTDLVSLARRRLLSVISDFRPPSVTESGEAVDCSRAVPSEVIR